MAKAFILKGKEGRVESGHPWIFKSDIYSIEGDFEPGDVVDIYSSRKKFLGRGYINPRSQITIRILTYNPEKIDYGFFYQRIQDAWEYRKKVSDINCCRVVFAESDFLPALIIDKFSEYLVLQSLALGIERYKTMFVDILKDIICPEGIFERDDVQIRELEGLNQSKGFLYRNFVTKVRIKENGIYFDVDIENGQKTGYFLDQKENRAALQPFVNGAKVLDCFSHTGSFALHAAHYGAKEVAGIDISEHAAEYASHNAKINGFDSICSFETANVFDKLRELENNHQSFDTIILDPPAFAKARNAVEGAIRGYKEINLRAMKIINRGGFLITCSCSHHVDKELFMNIIYDAAIDSKRKIRLLELRSQSKDHPVLISSTETEYLKCAILQVL